MKIKVFRKNIFYEYFIIFEKLYFIKNCILPYKNFFFDINVIKYILFESMRLKIAKFTHDNRKNF